MKIIKKISIYFFVFLFFLFLNLMINQLQNDEIWNYGFSYNLYRGLIPYKDFNMVVTPFYPFLMSLPFHLFGSNLLIFHITNACLLTICTFFIYQLISNKIYLLGLLAVLFSNSVTFPSYNFFLLFLMVLLVYCEKNNKNDLFIGFLIGLIFLTKQSVGFFMFFSIFYFLKEKKAFFKRFIGFVIPCFFFFFYLVFSKTFFSFLDLCFFGLFDFGTKNSSHSWFGYAIFIIYLLLHFVILRKKKSIYFYYSLFFSSMMIPLFDLNHIIIPYLFFFFVCMMECEFSVPVSYPILFFVSSFLIISISFYRYHDGYSIHYPNSIPKFQFRMIREDSLELTEEVCKYLKKHKKDSVLFMNTSAYYFRLITDTPISYIDLTNNGNFGYHGSSKMIEEVKKYPNSYIFINMNEYHKVQTDQKVLDYIMKNSKKVDSLWIYDIYYYEGDRV